jgi:predicted secreted hydrolase
MRRAFGFLLAGAAAASVAQVDVTGVLGRAPAPGFAQAMAPRAFAFPADHGPHPEFRNEWWYFTGNLADADGRHFGFQLTFFRVALSPVPATRESAWATNQAWMAHFTLTDTALGRFHTAERLGRGAVGLAGAKPSPFRVWLGDWQATGQGDSGFFPLRLTAAHEGFAIELELSALKPLVLQGDRGWDRKGPEPGNASHYYSYPRLAARGSVRTPNSSFDVTGTAWMDREWGTSALGPALAGWDWLSLQLSDGRDLMLYRLRRKDGSADAFSKGALVLPDGTRIALSVREFEIEPRRWWTSPTTRVRYPVAWSIEIPAMQLALEIEPRLDNQELNLSVRYWEGAVLADGRAGGERVTGQGYLELAGY